MRIKPPSDRLFLEAAGRRTTYVEQGTGPPPLVLVHGVGLRAAVWAPQMDEFAADHRVVAYDTLGHGTSDHPEATATLADYVDQLRGLLDVLSIDRALLMGHSMGALIATLFAIEHPGRAACLIAASPVYRRAPGQLAASRARVRQLESRGPDATLESTVARWFGAPASREEASRIEQIRTWIRDADPTGYARAYRVFSEADPWLNGRLVELQCPALFVTGALDPNSTPAMARTMAAEAPLGYCEILEGERHMMAYKSPACFNTRVRRFLTEVAAPGGAAASTLQGTRTGRP